MFTLIRGGYQAVTTFFVLSGFVLTRSYAATLWNRRNTLRYALGRVARVYPGLPVQPGGGGAVHRWRTRHPGKAGYVAAHLLLVQAWLGAIPVNWNTPAWSLSCEMFFYAVFPLAALFIRRANWRSVAAGGRRRLLSDARDVGGGSVRQYQAAGAFERLSDGDRGRLRLRSACSGARGRREGWWLYVPGFAGRGRGDRVSRACCRSSSI